MPVNAYIYNKVLKMIRYFEAHSFFKPLLSDLKKSEVEQCREGLECHI